MRKKNSGFTKDIATPKQTSGAGFAFEDKIVAYYLVWMLTGNPPFDPIHGGISRLDCQVKVDGWLLDDLLITAVQKGRERHYAFSIKSNVQFLPNAAPLDFIRDAWALLLHKGSDVFNLDLDMMGLICVPQPNPPIVALQSLLKKARVQTPDQLSSRIEKENYASNHERNLFKSFSCPNNFLITPGPMVTATGELLKRITVIELDFDRNESQSEAKAIFLCRALLSDGSIEKGVALWDALCQKAHKLRTGGGGSTRDELLTSLRMRFEFRDFPDLSEDLYKLRAWSELELKVIIDQIGGRVKIERDDIIDNLLYSIARENFTILVAPSGAGKTVIGKWTAEEFSKRGDVLWFDAGRLRPTYIEYFSSLHGLEHPLRDVLNNRTNANGLIILDGAERLREVDDFKEAATLLNILGIDKPGCIWRILITCQAEEWERVQIGLIMFLGQSIKWDINPLQDLKFKDLQPVWQAFPALHALAIRPHLMNFIMKPKVLDIFAVALQSGIELDDRTWIGESDIIKWYWKNVVHSGKQGITRSTLLQRIAEIEANNGIFEFPESELTASDEILIPNLKGILSVKEDRATITFAHDLFADWARLIAILSHQATLKDYIKDKYKNPHWHKALRLYGVLLLEEDNTAKVWETKLKEFPEIRNFLLEALVFTGNSSQLLLNSWPILIDNGGKLLRDLLMRFLYFATYPNPQYLQIAKEVGATDSEARTWERLPLWMYWLGLLDFFASHTVETIQYAPIEIARVAYTWLRYSPNDWPNREHAAILALAVGQEFFRNDHYSHDYSKSELQYPFKALLEAFPEKPNEVRQLVLKACGRITPTIEDGEAFKDFKRYITINHDKFVEVEGKGILAEPRKDGPLYRPNELFKEVCLETDALNVIMQADPALAREIILALLIALPHTRRESAAYEMNSLLHEPTGLDADSDSRFYPGFYTRGPFLLFLRIDPKHALELIIRLVDFATDQLMKTRYKETAEQIGITLHLPSHDKFFRGNVNTYYWYNTISRNNIVLSALTAIEKWLYEYIEKNETVNQWISYIFENGNSTAFVGLLSEIGRYSPNLFTNVLKPLLLSPEPYHFEILFIGLGGHIFGTPYSIRDGELFFNLARKWNSMQHRRVMLLNIARNLFCTSKELRNDLVQAAEEWKLGVKNSDDKTAFYLQQLIANFDPKNWRKVVFSDNSEGMIFQAPEALVITKEEQEKTARGTLLITRPLECREKLDKSLPLAEEQVEEYLDQAKMLVDFEPKQPGTTIIPPAANSVLGTIAVLFYFHRQWLHDNPAEETWCLNYFKNTLEDRQLWSSTDNQGSTIKDTWEDFICEIVAVLWAENPKSKDLQRIIAQLVVTTHNYSLEILIRRTFEKRQVLGRSFWELVNFIWERAEISYQLGFQPTRKKINVPKWRRKAASKFVKGRYAFNVPTFGKSNVILRPSWEDNIYDSHIQGDQEANIFCPQPKIDVEQIKYIFSNIFLPNQATDQSECVIFLDFWSRILEISLMRIRIFDKEGKEIDSKKVDAGLPTDFDYWILEKIGIVIAQLNHNNHSERFWLPILSLGPRAEHWIERFLSNWFLAVKRSVDKEQFIYHWQQMFNYCLSSEIWIKHEGLNSYHLPSLWLNLIGISNIGDLWDNDDKEIIIAMREYFVRSTPHFLYSNHDVERLASWLEKASSAPIRLDMLVPLASASVNKSDYWLQERKLCSSIAGYLNILWEEHRQEVVSKPEFQKAFEELLHIVTDLHEPLALELQTRISSGPRS